MADESAPASLPSEYRFKAPRLPACVVDMKLPEFTVSETAIRIDKTWGVWVDPKAPAFTAAANDRANSHSSSPDGYMVDLSYTQRDEFKKVWAASLMESFAGQGFVPARYAR